jgi:hypothetical protein
MIEEKKWQDETFYMNICKAERCEEMGQEWMVNKQCWGIFFADPDPIFQLEPGPDPIVESTLALFYLASSVGAGVVFAYRLRWYV